MFVRLKYLFFVFFSLQIYWETYCTIHSRKFIQSLYNDYDNRQVPLDFFCLMWFMVKIVLFVSNDSFSFLRGELVLFLFIQHGVQLFSGVLRIWFWWFEGCYWYTHTGVWLKHSFRFTLRVKLYHFGNFVWIYFKFMILKRKGTWFFFVGFALTISLACTLKICRLYLFLTDVFNVHNGELYSIRTSWWIRS